MKKNKWLFSFSIFFVLALMVTSISTPVFAQGTASSTPADEASTSTYTLADLTGIGDIVLNGTSPSYSFYIPVPSEWQLTGMVMRLNLTHSELLRSSSTLTLQINNVPVSSLQLGSSNTGPYEWDVTIPAEYISGDVIAVSLVGFMRVTNNVCDDIENSANWIRIASQSAVDFLYTSLPLKLSLDQYPYPLIRTQSLTADTVSLIVPDDATGEEMTSAFTVASSLGSMGTWRGLTLTTLQEKQFTDEIKSQNDVLLVGTADRLNLSSLGVTWSLTVNSGKLVKSNKSVVPDTSGVIMIAQSPWNSDKAVVAVTGSTPAAVAVAAQALRNSQFANLIHGDYAIIPSLPVDLSVSNTASDWESTTFAALGYADQTVNGIGQHRISIPLNLPNGVQPKEITVKLVFSHSPFVSTDRSYLVLSANGIPQEGLYLDAKNESQSEWTVTIPADQLIPGKNILSILFDLHLSSTEVCTDYYYDQAWAVLSRNSTVQVSFDTAAVTPDLSNYPSPFGSDTLIIVSPSLGENERNGTFQLISQMGSLLGKQSGNLQIMTSAQVKTEDLKGRSLILIGLPDKNSYLAEALKSAPVQLAGTSRTLKTTLFDLTAEDGQPVGLVQEIISPWDSTRSALLITGSNDQGMGWAAELLSTSTRIKRLSGNIAIVDKNGGLTLANSFEPAKSVTPITSQADKPKGPSERTFWLAVIAALVVVVAILILILIRRRVEHH